MTASNQHQPTDAENKFNAMMRDLGDLVNTSAEGLYAILGEGNDWAFIVKMCALVETAVSQLITNVSDEPHLAPLMQVLAEDFLGKKVNYVAAMALLSDQSISTARGLARIRNQLVHSIENLDFSLAKHLAASPDNLDIFIQGFGRLQKPQSQVEYDAVREIVKTDARLLMKYAVVALLREVYQAKSKVLARASFKRVDRAFANLMIDNLRPPDRAE